MKLYVAGKWADKPKISEMMSQLKSLGHTIIHDWTQNEIEERTPEAMQKYAILDLHGVKNSDIVVAIMDSPDYAYRGTFTEIGYALGNGVPVYIYCNKDTHYCFTNIFFHYPSIRHFNKWDDLVSSL